MWKKSNYDELSLGDKFIACDFMAEEDLHNPNPCSRIRIKTQSFVLNDQTFDHIREEYSEGHLVSMTSCRKYHGSIYKWVY